MEKTKITNSTTTSKMQILSKKEEKKYITTPDQMIEKEIDDINNINNAILLNKIRIRL